MVSFTTVALFIFLAANFAEASSVCPLFTGGIRPKFCKKQCTSDDDCRKHKRCVCDGECGMSCVNPGISCQAPSDIPNGRVHWSGDAHFGSNVEYSCEEGFILVGPSQRRCQGNREWSGAHPVCRLQLKCGPPPEIAFAVHDGTSYSGEHDLETEVHYNCVKGYHTFNTKGGGMPIAKCLLNRKNVAQWFGPELKCRARACPDPGRPAHGRRDGDIFEFPHSVHFTCNSGFLLIGSSTRKCDIDGDWTGVAPTCKPTECPRPSDPLHGRVIGSSLTFGSLVTYTCDEGYRLVGQLQRICLAEAVWAGREPKCEEIHCPPLPPLMNGYVEGAGGSHFGARVSFRCLEAMTHDGPSEAVCLENGQWSAMPPTCLGSCAIPKIENGNVPEGAPGKLVASGTKLQVVCQPRHMASPDLPFECINSTWDHIPSCKPLDCKDWPPRVAHARVLFKKTEHDAIARYTCSAGYHLRGKRDTIKCLYGEWRREGPEIVCEATSCKHPKDTFGMLTDGDIFLEGQMGTYGYQDYIKYVEEGRSIVFQCHKGYYLIGPPKASCVNGEWMPKVKPRCFVQTHPLIDGQIVWDRTRRELEPLPTQAPKKEKKKKHRKRKHRRKAHQKRQLLPCPPMDGDRRTIVTRLSEHEIVVSCRVGFHLAEGLSDHLRCVDGAWSAPLPECLSDPPEPEFHERIHRSCHVPVRLHAFFVIDSTSQMVQSGDEVKHDTEARIICLRGYNMQGPSKLKCEHGILTSVPGECKGGVPCPLPSHLSILFDPPRSIIEDEETVTIQCQGIDVSMHCHEGIMKEPVECAVQSTTTTAPSPSSPSHCSYGRSLFSSYKGWRETPDCDRTRIKKRREESKEKRSSVDDSLFCAPPILERGLRILNMDNYIPADYQAFPHDTVLQVGCSVSTGSQSSTEYRCRRGEWEITEELSCVYGGAPCSFVQNSRIDVVASNGDTEETVHFNQMFNDGAHLVFRCDDVGGLKMKGKGDAICRDGVWSNPLPTCLPLFPISVKRDSPPIAFEVLNGPHSISSKGELLIDRSATVIFSCVHPKRLGDPRWEVISTYRSYPRAWGTVDAFGEKNLEAYQLTVAVAQPEDSGIFHCVSSTERRHGVRLRVLDVYCPPLSNSSFVYVHLSRSSFFVGSTAQFSCPRGYSIRGATTSLCTDKGEWSHQMPTCEPAECSPFVIDNRSVQFVRVTSFRFGGLAEFSCRKGYSLKGERQLHCTADGRWNAKPPECIETRCGEPSMPANGYIIGEPFVSSPPGATIKFGCLDHYTLSGDPYIVCHSDGQWSTMSATCTPA